MLVVLALDPKYVKKIGVFQKLELLERKSKTSQSKLSLPKNAGGPVGVVGAAMSTIFY
jgi:hypothetical protein